MLKEALPFPTIAVEATGRSIVRLRKLRGLTAHDLQEFFGFDSPSAIYQWQGECPPGVDSLYALSAILRVPMNETLMHNQSDCAAKRSAPHNFYFKRALVLPRLLVA